MDFFSRLIGFLTQLLGMGGGSDGQGGGMSNNEISHALVIPDDNFNAWLQATQAYTRAFERVAIVRGTAGNDLNRFRNVTAVQAPLMWVNDDALLHIRRVFTQVVTVDIIPAKNPQQLSEVLQRRINADDRYGAQDNDPQHLFERFTLYWPSLYSPARIVRGFSNDANNRFEGLDIASKQGSKVIAGATGAVIKVSDRNDALGYGPYVQVRTVFAGETFVVIYGGLQNIVARQGDPIRFGDVVGESAGNTFRFVVQKPGGGQAGFRLPDVIDPVPLIYWQDMRVRPTDTGVRIRSAPNTSGEVLGQVGPLDTLESLETHGRTLLKLGTNGQWLRVRFAGREVGYAAAWFLEAAGDADVEVVFPGINPVGVNLDVFHPLGAPDTNRLGGLGWVRMGYNVSEGRGSTDLVAAYNRYFPHLQAYARAGRKVMLTLTHQTFGEAQGYNWNQMNDGQWSDLTNRFAQIVGQIARQYAGKGVVHVYQIWNEQDAPAGAGSSVPLTPQVYGRLLKAAITAIRSADENVYIITGGHTAGPVNGSNYAKAAIAATGGVKPNGVAFHPYGRGTPDSNPNYRQFGYISESVDRYSLVLPGKPVWITEWGILDRPGDNPADIGRYATDFISYLKTRYGNRVATMIWYAWAQGMHNGYGIVDTGSNARPGLTDPFLRA